MYLFKEIIYPLFEKKKGDIQMDIRESFSENLKKQMKNYNSQEEFANYIGISHSMLQMYLHKKGNPRPVSYTHLDVYKRQHLYWRWRL